MAIVTWPTSPTNGQTHDPGSGTTYVYNATAGGWQIQNPTTDTTFNAPDAVIGTAVPDNGLIWASDGGLYINNTGANLTPTGTTAAQLATDGFTAAGGSASFPLDTYALTENQGGRATGASPTTIGTLPYTATSDGLVLFGLQDLQGELSSGGTLVSETGYVLVTAGQVIDVSAGADARALVDGVAVGIASTFGSTAIAALATPVLAIGSVVPDPLEGQASIASANGASAATFQFYSKVN